MTASGSRSVHFGRTLAALMMLLPFGRQTQAAIEKASEQVSPFYGSLSRSVPIEVPVFHGLEPKLAFSYSSEGRNGFLGVGWSLSGISTIERVNAGLGTPRWDDLTDTYILDGQALVPCPAESPSCSSGGTHTTRDESYLKIVYNPDNTWTVYGRDGTRTIFSPTLQPGTGHTLRWGQTSTIDTKGNTVTTTWTVLDGETYPESISYNGYSISFGREATPRSDRLFFAAADILGKTLYRLRNVFVWLGPPQSGTPIRAYRLLYSYSPLTSRSLLTSIEQLGKDVNNGGLPLPAQTFTYQNDTLGKGFYPISGDPPSPPATQEDVVWTNLVNTAATGSGNSLTRTTGPPEWNAGGASTRALAAGSGYVEVTATVGANTVFGLSNGNGDASIGDIDFGIYQNNNDGKLYVFESGLQYGPFGDPIANGQLLRVEIQGSQILYKQNGVILRQVQKHLRYPLLVDASIWTVGGTISNAVLNGSLRYVSHWCGGELQTADVNGDGRTDQVCYRSDEKLLQVALATATGFDSATEWGTDPTMQSKWTMGDFNGDGKADVAFYHPNADFYVSLSTGTAFSMPLTLWGNAHGTSPNPPHYDFACLGGGGAPGVIGTGDFDGDGVTDISCRRAGLPQAFIGLSRPSATPPSFAFSIFGEASCGFYESTGAIDFDGDGKDDWYCTSLTESILEVFPSTGSSFEWPAFGSLDNNFCSGNYVLGDFNGDGRTDAACGNSGRIALSTGRHFEVQPEPPGPPVALCADATGVFAADVDGDGASEIVCNRAEAPANDIEVRKWDGETQTLTAADTWKGSWCSANVLAGDFNGDNKTDLICTALSSPAVAGTGGFQSDLLASAGNGMGGTSQTTYTTSVNFQNTNNPPPKWVVSARSLTDGRGGVSNSTYTYAGGYMDRKERRFLGFREVTETLPCVDSDCPSVVTTLKQDLASVGKPAKVERRDGSGYVLRKSEYVYATNETPPRTSLLTEERSYFTDEPGPAKQTKAVHQYDAYGNSLQTVFHGDMDENGDELTSTWAFSYNTSAYIVDRPSVAKQFEGVGTGGQTLSERRYFYDGSLTWGVPPSQGFLTRVDSWLDIEARYVSRTMVYDSWGNLIEARDETNRPTFTGWDTTHHVYPTSVTNGANETETATWDALCGVPLERRDANDQPTTYQSDNYCRPNVTNYPLGGFEIRTYLNLGTATAQHVRIETPSALQGAGSLNDYVLEYFDGRGRTYKTIKKGIPTQPTIRKDITYNARGGVASDTAPYYDGYEPVHTTSYKVDSLDRLKESLFPDTNKIQKDYGIWSETTIDEHGHPTTTRFDAYGRKKQAEQHINTGTLLTDYTYDLLGRLTGLRDPIGIEWSWTFDSLGRLTSKSDPDSGASSFEYDDAGRLVQQTDAKSQQTDISYDGAGRLMTKMNSAGTVTISHSEVRPGYFNVGHVTSVATAAGGQAFDYDAAGRPVRQARLLDGSLYVAERRYDSAGRLRGITYPDNDAIGTEADPLRYDAAGRLYSVPGILTEILYDGAGRPTSHKAADSPQTVTTKTYSSRGFLTDISTGTNGSIQDLHYQLDAAGLVDEVTSPVPNEGWDYSYDELHRMYSAQSVSDPGQSQTFQYDAANRMTYNSLPGLGTYSYPSVGSPHPHAPSSINGQPEPYLYDPNGNLYSGGGRGILWNADNLVTQVTKAGTTTNFTYDGLGERVKKMSSGSTSLYPMGDDYEVTNGIITKYVNVAGLGVIAKRVGTTPYWLHTDRLGSIQAITDANGLEVQRRTYRPYGDKIGNTTSHVESRGYIDQRQDAETGLTYLHARYYDPALGVFISPDPLGPAGGLSLYSYAAGNPISASDRSGLDPAYCFGGPNNDIAVCGGEEVEVRGSYLKGGYWLWFERRGRSQGDPSDPNYWEGRWYGDRGNRWRPNPGRRTDGDAGDGGAGDGENDGDSCDNACWRERNAGQATELGSARQPQTQRLAPGQQPAIVPPPKTTPPYVPRPVSAPAPEVGVPPPWYRSLIPGNPTSALIRFLDALSKPFRMGAVPAMAPTRLITPPPYVDCSAPGSCES